MEQNVSMLSDWLNTHVEQTLVIEKHELEDMDIVHFKLESVEFRNGEDTVDDYLDNALVLKGTGNTTNADGERVPLPQHSYEIAVSGLNMGPSDEKKLQVNTKRAKYILSIEE
ncbi:hypothetical protein [Paenibacillus wynnii]|uniref:Uncharacterized protein n=1 Tax=Paenibacillus wynnii TaxID=268407 RepID=A0A098M3T9_9BACL|nr:hypothetical protein [Paenibacillus wynnii]KGE17204.1 hypothetical protein PWYN_21450 [Paenibacillus wynnii]